MPQSFAGINVAEAGELRLIGKKYLRGKAGFLQNCTERRGCEVSRENIHAKFLQRWRRFDAFVPIHSPKMPRVDEAECHFIERKQHIHMHIARRSRIK